MLFGIYRNWFQSLKGMVTGWTVCWHRHYLETLDQPFFRCCGAAVAMGILSWLICPSGLVSIWKAPCWLTNGASSSGRSGCLTLLLLMKTVPLPSMGKGMWAWKSCKQSRGANLTSAGQKGESLTSQRLTIKPHLSPWRQSLQACVMFFPCLVIGTARNQGYCHCQY